ncbi:hypothetical protein [Ktedonospora formicarum]|nr:hypothetical protein [Ktedonospora formicarum]
MFKNLLRWIVPLIVLLIVITVIAIGSITYTHAAGVDSKHTTTEQVTPTPNVKPNIFWPGI